MRRTQLYLSEEQHRWLIRQAGREGSIASVVRELIDRARNRGRSVRNDPFVRYLLDEPPARGKSRSSVTTIDKDLYGA